MNNTFDSIFIYILGMIVGVMIGTFTGTSEQETEKSILDTCKKHAKVELAGVTVVCATQSDINAKLSRRQTHV